MKAKSHPGIAREARLDKPQKRNLRQRPAVRREAGVALVITLILLSVITFMAVTFLVISRHEAAQVDTLSQQAAAKNAADSGAQQAVAQIMAQALSTGNGLNGNLTVSTNFMSLFFDNSKVVPGGYSSITNVSYFYGNGLPVSGNDLLQMLSNQVILPRAPVFVVSNKNQTTSPDFRFWLDLNRNGVYDTNGAIFEMDENGALVKSIYVGDPEWVGILNHPEQRHSANNFYVGRYAFIALPIGNSLDVNYIHNQSKLFSDVWQNGYLRNQGVGSWELNLAAFMHHLNTNWDNGGVSAVSANPYAYQTNSIFQSAGRSFEFATEILQYRYAQDYHNLRPFKNMFDKTGANPLSSTLFANDYVDGYSRGPLMTGLAPLTLDPDNGFIKSSWSGDYSPNQYFTTQDLFNNVPVFRNQVTSPLSVNSSFSNQLYAVGRKYRALVNSTRGDITNSYNRYTFYRMLSQMSFGSAPEPVGYGALNGNTNFNSVYGGTPKMNLNYVNVGGQSGTNFIAWTPSQFFTNAADRMLRAYFPNPIGVTNGQRAYLSLNYIPIWPTNYYTPAVHRILQLAANIYDSLTNRIVDNATPALSFPSVFRPHFASQTVGGTTNLYISGYNEVASDIDFTPPKDLRRNADLLTLLSAGTNIYNVYGVPYVLGAKKGFPSFNKFSSLPTVQIFREMEVVRPSAGAAYGSPGWQFHARYTLAVSNIAAIECWYPSTSNAYPRAVEVNAIDDCNTTLTTSNNGVTIQSNYPAFAGLDFTIPANSWRGSPNMNGTSGILSNSFQTVLYTNVPALASSYLQGSPLQYNATFQSGAAIPFESTPNYFIPTWTLSVTNRVRLMMLDKDAAGRQRLIDYVELGGLGGLAGPDTFNNINSDLTGLDQTIDQPYRFWTFDTTNSAGVPAGFNRQVQASIGPNTPPPSVWKQLALPPNNSIAVAMQDFRDWLTGANGNTSISKQVPLVAFKNYVGLNSTWSANDPLVHYTIGDLTDALNTPTNYVVDPSLAGSTVSPLVNPNGIPFGRVNSKRYQPWNVTQTGSTSADVQAHQLAYKDPLIGMHDSWQFMTNKFPNIGWLGRVHRGTPWQTVYLKSQGVDTNNWMYWTGDLLTNYFTGNDPFISRPANDWLLMDLFTTSPNDNASRGQLSINQTNEAAWAAVLDGVIAINNTNNVSATNIAPAVISPADLVNGTNTVQYLVGRINSARTNYIGNTFTSLGQILSVPELTVSSPYLNQNFPNSLSDAAYERIPQQIMSLLRLGSPRYVIFSYGQSLKPADRSVVQSGPYFGMCTNYQITGEVATRTVVRIDNYPVPGQPQTKPRAVVESFNVLGPE